MPTENEYKYLLRRDEPTLTALSQAVFSQRTPGSIINIEQGCLEHSDSMTLRVRRAVTGTVPQWLLTMKQDTAGRVVEIETVLSTRDGEDLWSETYNRLKKTRYKIEHDGLLWEVDKFLDGQHVYCVLAEVELPEGTPPPDSLPPFVAEHLLHAVKQGDGRFSNKRLWKIPHAERLYQEFQNEARV